MKKKNSFNNVMAVIILAVLVLAGCKNPAEDKLPSPKNLRAVVSMDSYGAPVVTLTWTPVSGALYYAVYQSTDSTWSDYVVLTTSESSTEFFVKI